MCQYWYELRGLDSMIDDNMWRFWYESDTAGRSTYAPSAVGKCQFTVRRTTCSCACKNIDLGNHEQQMMVISSPLSDFVALWSSHCQVKNRPHGADSADPYYHFLLFSVARGVANNPLLSTLTAAIA